MACCKVQEVHGWRMKMDVEAVFDALEYCVLVDVVVAGINYADGLGPALLSSADSCPKDTLTTASCIAMAYMSGITTF